MQTYTIIHILYAWFKIKFQFQIPSVTHKMGAHGSVVGWGTMLQTGRSRVRFPKVIGFIQLNLTFQPHYDLGVDSTSWLRHYDTSRKVASLIPNDVNEFFNYLNPSSRTMALESIQPLIKMSTRNLPAAKGRYIQGIRILQYKNKRIVCGVLYCALTIWTIRSLIVVGRLFIDETEKRSEVSGLDLTAAQSRNLSRGPVKNKVLVRKTLSKLIFEPNTS
jgi:hypothetical protein